MGTATLRVLYRDADRTPYLFTLRRCARALGLALEMIEASARSPEWSERLGREDVDVITDNYWRLQVDRAKGAPYVSVATASNVFPERLFVHPSVRSIDELRGRRFAVRPAGPQLLFPAMWLRDHGLFDDVEQVVCPESETGRWGHWKLVAAGECHGCFITDLYTDGPIGAGLVELPVGRYAFADGYITLTTTEGIISRKRDEVQTLVDAAFDASRAFTSNASFVLDVMRTECHEGLAEHVDIPDDRALERIYRKLVVGFSQAPVPTAEGIINAYRLNRDAAPEMRAFNPLLMWDLSFARRAMGTR